MSNKPLNILVVDDDENFAHTLCAILKSEGYQCREVHSAKEAVLYLEKEHFDCVLSDVKMPEKNGADFYQEIKDQYPHLPFILMTAYTSSEVIDDAIQSGVLTAIQKPINIREVLGFFTRLSSNIQAAIICEQQGTCDVIQKALEKNHFIFTIFKSIQSLIDSRRNDYSIVFVDSHDFCEHFSNDMQKLLTYLPERTIVVICDYMRAIHTDNLTITRNNLNLIILPRERKLSQKIGEILEKEYYQYAKNSFL